MTAGPDRTLIARTVPAWYVVTNQGVVLSGRFEELKDAEAEYKVVVARIRRELVREEYSEKYIRARIGAVRIDWGVLVGAWGLFESRIMRSGKGPED